MSRGLAHPGHVVTADERAFHPIDLGGGTVRRRVLAEILPLDPADAGYVRHVWYETHHQAPGKRRIPWSAYKIIHGAKIDTLLTREDVWILAAYGKDRRVMGWIAWTPGRIPAVHYVHVRGEARRQGLARRLLEAAELGESYVYTHRGLKPKGCPAMDDVMVAALARRGVTATYVPVARFLG